MNDKAQKRVSTADALAVSTENVSPPSILEKAVLIGDLSKLAPLERLEYYRATCESLGLNPLTRPFQYITLNGRLTLYIAKDGTDQLRQIRGISITDAERDTTDEKYATWIVTGTDRNGRTDIEIGSVPIHGLTGEKRSNATMKALTKAKRRLTLSLSGLGMMDESEIDSTDAKRVKVDPATGEIMDAQMSPAQRMLVERAQNAPEPAPEGEVDTESTPTTGGPQEPSYEPTGEMPAWEEMVKQE